MCFARLYSDTVMATKGVGVVVSCRAVGGVSLESQWARMRDADKDGMDLIILLLVLLLLLLVLAVIPGGLLVGSTVVATGSGNVSGVVAWLVLGTEVGGIGVVAGGLVARAGDGVGAADDVSGNASGGGLVSLVGGGETLGDLLGGVEGGLDGDGVGTGGLAVNGGVDGAVDLSVETLEVLDVQGGLADVALEAELVVGDIEGLERLEGVSGLGRGAKAAAKSANKQQKKKRSNVSLPRPQGRRRGRFWGLSPCFARLCGRLLRGG